MTVVISLSSRSLQDFGLSCAKWVSLRPAKVLILIRPPRSFTASRYNCSYQATIELHMQPENPKSENILWDNTTCHIHSHSTPLVTHAAECQRFLYCVWLLQVLFQWKNWYAETFFSQPEKSATIGQISTLLNAPLKIWTPSEVKIDIKEKWHCAVKWEGIVGTSERSAAFHVRELLTICNCLTYRPTFPFDEVCVMRFKLRNAKIVWNHGSVVLAALACHLWIFRRRSWILAPKFVLKIRCGHHLKKAWPESLIRFVSMVILVKTSTIWQYGFDM